MTIRSWSGGLLPIKQIICAASLMLGGCVGHFDEVHLLATVDKSTGETVNIFRVSVTGDTQMTNARYLAGFFDERAVEAFFNETKAQTIDYSKLAGTGVPSFSPLVPCADPASAECKTKTQELTKLVPLGSKATDAGVFVLLLSTNPDAIASTINSFVDSDQVVQSAMFLATRDDRMKVAEIGATATTTADVRSQTFASIGTLLGKAEATGDGAPTNAQRTAYYRAVLQEAASGLAPGSAPSFATLAEAKNWFDALPRGGAQ